MKMLPIGDTQKLWDLRMMNLKPNEMVLVSLIGDLTEGNWQIFPGADVHPKNYEWRWATDLQICLVYDSTCHKDRVKATALAIAKHHSVGDQAKSNGFHGSLYLWNTSLKAGAHMTYTPEIPGDPHLDLQTHPEETKYRNLYHYELPFFTSIESPV